MAKHGRHSAQRDRHPRAESGARPAAAARRRTAPLLAFLAVVAVALGGWTLIGRPGTDGAREAGLLADARGDASAPVTDRATGPATTEQGTTAQSGSDRAGPDRGSRDTARTAPLPKLGSVVPAPPTTKRAAPTLPGPRPTTTSSPRPTPGTPAPAPTGTGTSDPSYGDEVTRLTNVERAKAGCPAVKTDARLAAAALTHSKDMVDRNYFSHDSPDGKGPGDRASAAGYASWSGENIAAGYATPAAVVQGWMNSPGHKANILNCRSKATGVGFDPRKNMWTQMFGSV